MATWRIDIVTLNKLWQNVYPRMIGQAWVSDDYMDNFYHSNPMNVEQFLRREFRLRGIVLDGNLSLRIFEGRQPNFRLAVDGELRLPSPRHLKPERAKDVYEAYETQRSLVRGGDIAFPGTPRGVSPFSAVDFQAVSDRHFVGDKYRDVLNIAPARMADVWSENLPSPGDREDSFKRKMSDAEAVPLPQNPLMAPMVKEGSLDYYMTGNGSSWSFYFPMPAPPSLPELFRMFASGEIANPILTGTV